MLKPMIRALALPVAGGVVGALARRFNKHALWVNVRCHVNNFFFRDGDLPTAGTAHTSIWRNVVVRTFRPSLKHDRGFAAVVTSSDDGDHPMAGSSGIPAEVARRFMEDEAAYEHAFGFERFWEGAARGLTLVGLSPIHNRGIFALQDIPKGTLILSPRRTQFLDPISYIVVNGRDMVQQMKWEHYSHHTGAMFTPPTNASAIHLVNHSCDPNMRSGFRFKHARPYADYAISDPQSTDRNEVPVIRYQEDPGDVAGEFVVDPHAYVAKRDIKRGEELTIDYGARVAPAYPGELGGAIGGPTDGPTYACRCGAAGCRGVLLKGAESWQFCLTHNQRRAIAEDLIKRKLDADDEFHDYEFVRRGLLRNRQPLIDLMFGPLCHPTREVTKINDLQIAVDNAVSFLNQVDAERDFRP